MNYLAISGEVKIETSPDFETHRTFTITVTASDNGVPKQSNNVTLHVTISDIDDNPPVFTQSSWSATVKENAVRGVFVIQVNATDDDFEMLHKTLYYDISGGNEDGVFGIGYENGSVFVANTMNLDRETVSKYELTIEAKTLNDFLNGTAQMSTAKV